MDSDRLAEARKYRLAPRHARPGVVYYIRIGELVKIGFTVRWSNRRQGYPPTAELLAMEPGTLLVEAQRHAQFAHLLVHGREWFTDAPDIRRHIRTLPALPIEHALPATARRYRADVGAVVLSRAGRATRSR